MRRVNPCVAGFRQRGGNQTRRGAGGRGGGGIPGEKGESRIFIDPLCGRGKGDLARTQKLGEQPWCQDLSGRQVAEGNSLNDSLSVRT